MTSSKAEPHCFQYSVLLKDFRMKTLLLHGPHSLEQPPCWHLLQKVHSHVQAGSQNASPQELHSYPTKLPTAAAFTSLCILQVLITCTHNLLCHAVFTLVLLSFEPPTLGVRVLNRSSSLSSPFVTRWSMLLCPLYLYQLPSLHSQVQQVVTLFGQRGQFCVEFLLQALSAVLLVLQLVGGSCK